MLRIDKSTYLSLPFKFILSERLNNSARGSDVLLFLEFINIVSMIILNSLYCYILFSNLFCSIQKNVLFGSFHLVSL